MCYIFENLRDGKSPGVRRSSLELYVSGIRITHEALEIGYLSKPSESFYLKAAMVGFKNLEGTLSTPTSTRIAIPPKLLYRIL